MRCILVFVAAACGPLMSPVTTWAEAAPAPDSARIERLRLELRHCDDFAVFTSEAKLSTHRLFLSSEGPQPGRIIDRRGIASSPRLVSWTEIDSIQARRGATGAGIALGALAGLAVGLSIAVMDAVGHAYTLTPSTDTGIKPIALGIAGGMALGWLIDRPGHWQTVYP